VSAVHEVVGAILDDLNVNFVSFPVVWPNETFDPADPPSADHLSEFDANADHAIAQVTFFDAVQETHGRTTGGRSRNGELALFSRTARGKGPGAACEMAACFEDHFRARQLLSGEVDFGEPLSDEIGEIDGWYVWRTRCPFFQITTSP